MRRSGIVAGATAVALLVAVVAVRGGTAADEADLAVNQPEPSPAPSSAGAGPVLLAANGVPGLRLGTAPPSATESLTQETGAGCLMVWAPLDGPSGVGGTPPQVTWETTAWVVDGEVVSVVLASWSDGTDVTADLETWLGPTFGSPIEAAQELPGARSVTERPFGTLGPAVEVVTVPARGVEVVVSDLPPFGTSDRAGTPAGRITTMEVRKPAARDCALADVADPTGTGSRGWTVDLDGIGPLRLGLAASELQDAEGVTADGLPYDTGAVLSCQSFSLAGGEGLTGVARAVAVDGVVTEVQVYDTDLATSFGLPAGADADDVRARFPEVSGRTGSMMGSGVVQVVVDGVTVELQLQSRTEWVPDLERPAEGGVPTVSGVVVRSVGAPLYPC
ncbi:hypothetical protein [Aquipuribacter sp. MA13-6]|uniref:hypothetical protein n=1 Tax=unclassified Aquipuribacter TaxID=2635084 RepID=UPI003EEFC94D